MENNKVDFARLGRGAIVSLANGAISAFLLSALISGLFGVNFLTASNILFSINLVGNALLAVLFINFIFQSFSKGAFPQALGASILVVAVFLATLSAMVGFTLYELIFVSELGTEERYIVGQYREALATLLSSTGPAGNEFVTILSNLDRGELISGAVMTLLLNLFSVVIKKSPQKTAAA